MTKEVEIAVQLVISSSLSVDLPIMIELSSVKSSTTGRSSGTSDAALKEEDSDQIIDITHYSTSEINAYVWDCTSLYWSEAESRTRSDSWLCSRS